jgi:L-ascorbate metabolism protein UlaG (beta-lactamase superfamily)
MLILISILMVITVGIFLFMQRPDFGKAPSPKRVADFRQSSNYRNKSFQNRNPTPALTEGVTYTKVLKQFLFERNKNRSPLHPLPSVKTNLHSVDPNENIIVWFGHSSYFMQVDGKKILVDPVFSGNASPLPNTMKSFTGTDVYTVKDIPDIDFLFITHDHWDHLDYKTVTALKSKIHHIYTGLGVGEHLESWGFPSNMITEKDWNESIEIAPGFRLITAPARHFSGRKFTRNISLWMSFILITPTLKIYIGGDSGYDDHFRLIGDQYGPFDLAILECGQYNKNWKYIHMLPEEVVPAAEDLKAEHLMIVHWAKFPLSTHDWNEPGILVTAMAKKRGMSLVSPMIGEKVSFSMLRKDWPLWWEKQEA